MIKLSQSDIDYPRDIFKQLISDNSPYAFYLFQWVPYQTEADRFRLKMLHDVKTFDGQEAHGIWPNGDHCGPFKDEDVEFIRISKKQFTHEHTKQPIDMVKEAAPDLLEALKWYEEQARLCRLITSEGDSGRQALDSDGGQKARSAIAKARGTE